MVVGIAGLTFKLNRGFVPLFVSHIGYHLKSSIGESYVVLARCSIAMPTLLMTKIIVVFFYCILPIVIGLNLKEIALSQGVF